MRYEPTKDRAILKAVRENEPATTRDVADRIGYTLNGAVKRLHDLEERGKLESKKAGPALIWLRINEENPLTNIYNELSD